VPEAASATSAGTADPSASRPSILPWTESGPAPFHGAGAVIETRKDLSESERGNKAGAVLLSEWYPPGYNEKTKETKMTIVNFMSSRRGRGVRIVVGLVMLGLGLALGGGWLALSIVGLVPLAAGALDVCLIAPLLHQPLRGAGSPKA